MASQSPDPNLTELEKGSKMEMCANGIQTGRENLTVQKLLF